MDGSVVGAYISGQQGIEFLDAVDLWRVKSVQEACMQGSEIALHLAFAGRGQEDTASPGHGVGQRVWDKSTACEVMKLLPHDLLQ